MTADELRALSFELSSVTEKLIAQGIDVSLMNTIQTNIQLEIEAIMNCEMELSR